MPDERLRRIMVKGDLIINEQNANSELSVDLAFETLTRCTAIMTRSRTKVGESTRDYELILPLMSSPPVAQEYTSIPFPLKALKLILKDVQIVGPKGKGDDVANIEEDDGVSLLSCSVSIGLGLTRLVAGRRLGR